VSSLRIEIRDKRLRAGRLSISARTTRATVRRKREALVRLLLDRGDLDTVERLRRGELHFAELERAAREEDFDALRRPASSLTLGALLDRVLEIVEATKAEGTAKQYRVLRRQLLRELGADFEPATLTREQARAFVHRARLRRGGTDPLPWSPRKQAQVVALAGRAWRHAIEYEAELATHTGTRPRLTENPWRHVETPEIRATRNAFLRPEEWRAMVGVVRGRPVAAALGLGCLAGLRLAEVIHLRTDLDVDLAGRRLRIQSREGEHPWRPKTARGERDLRIGDELAGLLEEHVARGYAGERYLIRTMDRDRPVHSSTLANWTREAFEAAGIAYGRDGDALTFHSLRHTFASWLVQRDVQLKKVALLLGDAPDMVDRVYGHLLPTDLDRAVDLVSDIAEGTAEDFRHLRVMEEVR
jgi:integrase